jgi:hypothetical protein
MKIKFIFSIKGVKKTFISSSTAKTVNVRAKSTSYLDSTPKNTFKKIIIIINMRQFGL